jgi:hypothetical protein
MLRCIATFGTAVTSTSGGTSQSCRMFIRVSHLNLRAGPGILKKCHPYPHEQEQVTASQSWA